MSQHREDRDGSNASRASDAVPAESSVFERWVAERPQRELSQDEVRAVQLEILEQIDSFCRRSGLRYYLWAGSLLGAVRHGGYIPWDDDIDVAMPRVDFERLCHEFKADHLEVFTMERHARYAYPFARVADSRTLIVEGLAMSIPMGINVDIFPLDGWPANGLFQKVHRARLATLHKLVVLINAGPNASRAKLKELLRLFLQPVASRLPMRWIAGLISRTAQRYDFDRSAEVGVTVARSLKRIESRAYGAPCMTRFENAARYGPADPHAVLTNLYGDYMTPPPESQRTPNRHAHAAYRLAN